METINDAMHTMMRIFVKTHLEEEEYLDFENIRKEGD